MEQLVQSIMNKEKTISVIGLGYVGMPLAIAFADKINVIGFDVNKEKVALYKKGIDPTNEVGNERMEGTTIKFTSNESDLSEACIHIVAVPTPINGDKTPDLTPLISASKIIGRNLKTGSIVVYESTVYPGVTEGICVDTLEKYSGLRNGIDFKVGYSPERINPSDRVNTLEKIVKIVSGQDEETVSILSDLYEIIIEAGVYKASSIRVAEAAKVVENSQRDINIAFMNELAIVFDKMNIDTNEVINAMNTKWNALKFTPGLVGGHCIGVDPYYFLYEAQTLGYHSVIMSSARRINDSMGEYIGKVIIDKLILAGKMVNRARVAIIGVTFKENTPDVRNSKVFDISDYLSKFGVDIIFVDNHADPEETIKFYGAELTPIDELTAIDCVILSVPHEGTTKVILDSLPSIFKGNQHGNNVFIDVKGKVDSKHFCGDNDYYWSL